MKHFIIGAIVLFCLSHHAYATEPNLRMTVQSETLENGEASSVAMVSDAGMVYGGLSLNYIHSSEIIGFNNRQTIYPVYVFFGLKAPLMVTPYVEAGFDLGDALIDDLYNNGEDEESLIDYYYAGGLSFSLDHRISLLIYAKKYNLKFREYFMAPTVKNRPETYGVGLSMQF